MKKPVFQDLSGKRWMLVKIIILVGLLMFYVGVTAYALNHFQIVELTFINQMNVAIRNIVIEILIVYLALTIVIGFIRMFILCYFSSRQWRRNRIERENDKINQFYTRWYRPTVTVIIPVYNEEVVITKTVKAILHNSYPITEVLVMDDGSTDHTAAVVNNAFQNDSKVKLIRKKNGGKASGLNLGFQIAAGEIIITIDADTILHKHTIAYLVTNFKNPSVASVSGNCKIGNIRNQLTLWQHIEYVTANNIEKRALEELNCITVVPGSNSAWRKNVVIEAGLFDHDTLAEDTDLTLKLLNSGHKIVYDQRAISYEECPEKVKDFIKQRFRWSYGILQSLWKHKRNIYASKNKTLKFFAIPSLLFSYLLYLTSPLVDLIFIVAIFSGSKSVYFFALIFYITDFLYSVYAFKLERENMKPLVWVVIQRLAYRYLIAYVTWKAVIIALRGNQVGWGKLKRSGNNKFN